MGQNYQLQVGSGSNVWSEKNSVTITGSGFGTKTYSTPLLWDDFSSGTVGTEIAGNPPIYENSPVQTNWQKFMGPDPHTSLPPTYNAFTRDGSGNSSYHYMPAAGSGYDSALRWWQPIVNTGDEVFFSFYSYVVNDGTQWPRNYKPWDVYGSDYPGGSPAYYVGYGDYQLGDSTIRTYQVSTTYKAVYGNYGILATENRWIKYEGYFKISDPNTGNGSVIMTSHNYNGTGTWNTWANKTNYATRATSGYFEDWRFGWYWSASILGSDPPADYDTDGNIWLSDIYMDDTRKRFELGNNATYNSCTIREIQIPTSWSDTAVTVDVNQGLLSTGTNYLFFIDDDGSVSSLGEVTLV